MSGLFHQPFNVVFNDRFDTRFDPSFDTRLASKLKYGAIYINAINGSYWGFTATGLRSIFYDSGYSVTPGTCTESRDEASLITTDNDLSTGVTYIEVTSDVKAIQFSAAFNVNTSSAAYEGEARLFIRKYLTVSTNEQLTSLDFISGNVIPAGIASGIYLQLTTPMITVGASGGQIAAGTKVSAYIQQNVEQFGAPVTGFAQGCYLSYNAIMV